MKRITSIFLLCAIYGLCMADSYTIVFKDSGTGSDKTQKLTSTRTADYIVEGEDYVDNVSSENSYLAKSGYGLKLGTASAAGRISLNLHDTYKPGKITVTAAAYNAKQDSVSTKSFKVNDMVQNFASGIELHDYEFELDGETEVASITISANENTSNRLYINKVVIEAPDPAPLRGKIYCEKSIDLGYEHLSNGVVQTMTEIDVSAKNLTSNINLSISDNTGSFGVNLRSIPKEGGVVEVNFSSSRKARYTAILTLSSTGLDEQPVVSEVPVSIGVCSEIFHTGEADDPYTVADALSRMEELEDNETSSEWWYIRGYVASDSIAVSSSTGGLSFDLAWEGDTLYVYAMTAEGGALIDAGNIHKGDTLLIHSRLQNYVGYKESHKEVYMGHLISSDIPSTDWSQLRADYYENINHTADTTLKRVLKETISGGIRYTYGSGTLHTWDAFYHTDREEGSMLVLDMYSDNKRYFSEQNPTASVAELDIEHMFPKSWWGGEVNNAYKDLHHLVPADYSANRSKGNNAPGEVDVATFDNGSFFIGQPSSDCPAPKVFEPADRYKGDFARAYFYILTAYSDLEWDMSTPAAYTLDTSSPQLLQPWARKLLLSWHRQDPVSEKEIRRNAEVARIQHNRNPYIDYPCLVEYIWGERQREEVDLSTLLLTTTEEYKTTEDKSGCTCQCKNTDAESAAKVNDTRAAKKVLRDGTFRIVVGENQYTILGEKVNR